MSNDDERRSPGGSVIYRYQQEQRGWKPPAAGDDGSAELVEKHFAALGAAAEMVLHEAVSDLVHIDVHVCPPTLERPFYVLFTTGMSDLPMTVPAGAEEGRYAELLICLPSDWPMPESWGVVAGETPGYWPIGILKYVARFPHDHQTWLGHGHTIPNGNPPAPFDDGTKLCGILIAPPLTLPPDAHQVRVREDKVIRLHSVVLLHQAELDLKLAKGAGALYDLLDEHQVNEILDATRPPVTKRELFSISS